MPGFGSLLGKRGRRLFETTTSRLINRISSLGVEPWHLSISGLITALLSAILYWASSRIDYLLVIAASLLLLSGFFDALDGAVARASGKESAFGAFYDSMLDRVSDTALIIGITLSGIIDTFIGMLLLASTLLVSYTRARAEGLGVDMKGIGVFERAERMIFISTSSYIEYFLRGFLNYASIALLALNLITILQRVIHTKEFLRRNASKQA